MLDCYRGEHNDRHFCAKSIPLHCNAYIPLTVCMYFQTNMLYPSLIIVIFTICQFMSFLKVRIIFYDYQSFDNKNSLYFLKKNILILDCSNQISGYTYRVDRGAKRVDLGANTGQRGSALLFDNDNLLRIFFHMGMCNNRALI